jgi:hypothetical protein
MTEEEEKLMAKLVSWCRVLGAWPAVVLFVGCATTPAPVEQIKYFSQAFVAVNTVGQPLLDDLAISERALGRRNAVARAKKTQADDQPCPSSEVPWALTGDPALGYIEGYCLQHAPYFADIGDPPATAQMRGSLRVIERYAEVLTTLAEGRNVDQALGQVDSLGQDVAGLIALTGSNVAIGAALTALRPLLANIARQSSAEEARRLILDAAPTVTQLVAALRAAVPASFNTLTSTLRTSANVRANAAAAVKEIEKRRTIVSQYVVLLDRLQGAWDATVVAARNPGGARLSDLIARSAELRADVGAVRRALAALRNDAAN